MAAMTSDTTIDDIEKEALVEHQKLAPSSKPSVKPSPRISLSDITLNNSGTVKRIISALFPLTYSKTFYDNILKPEVADYCKIALYNDIPVGVVCCLLNRTEGDHEPPTLYLAALGVLAPYRRQGIASQLLSHVIKVASSPPAPPALSPYTPKKKEGSTDQQQQEQQKEPELIPRPSKIELHVHTANQDSKSFWQSQGFEIVSELPDYYPRLSPTSAYLFCKNVSPQNKD